MTVHHADHGDVTSQLYFEGDPYLDSDVANAIRSDLVLTLTEHRDDSGTRTAAQYDVVLASAK